MVIFHLNAHFFMLPRTIQRHPALDAGPSDDWNILIWIQNYAQDDNKKDKATPNHVRADNST